MARTGREPMNPLTSSQADMLNGTVIFRRATVFLHLALLAQSLWWFLAGEQPHVTSICAVLALIVLVLLLSALLRLRMPVTFLHGRVALLSELMGAVAVVALPVLHGAPASHAFPWLVVLGALFPLVLERASALASIAVPALAAGCLALSLSPSLSTLWTALLQALAVIAAGVGGLLHGRALRLRTLAVQQALHSQRHFEALARTAQQVFIITDSQFRIRFANQALHDLIGVDPSEIAEISLGALLQIDDKHEHLSKLHYLRDTPLSSIVLKHRCRHRDGHRLWLELHGYNRAQDEVIGGLMFSIVDVSVQVESETRLRDERNLLQAVLDHNPAMMYATDQAGGIILANLAFRQRFGLPIDTEIHRETIADLMLSRLQSHEAQAQSLLQQDKELLASGKPAEQEIPGLWNDDAKHWYRLSRYPLFDAHGSVNGLLCVAYDITERKQYRLELEHQALHDPLTGLPNRRYLLEAASEAIEHARRNAGELAVLLCDLDFFKSVNDTHGHDFGDKCLSEITRRLHTELSSDDFVARFGGNEFAVLMPVSATQARAKAENLLRAISRKMVVDDSMVKMQASIGIAMLEPAHTQPSELLRNADAALQQAKERGRNRVEMHNALHQLDALKRGQMDVALRFALERNELAPTFQPKVSSLTGRVKGFELLLRWHSSEYGTISPVDFIPIAEASGLVVPIGLWALEQACRQLKEWQPRHPDVTIAVNVSMRQLLHASFLYEVLGIIDRFGVHPGGIELELTETSVMANPLVTIDTLTRLKDLGLRVSLDDFGTGYSSLSYLQRLPIDLLKIDKAFIRGLGHNASDAEIVRLILALAQTLNLETVAEGVETREQMMELKKMGCYTVQGYVFSETLSTAEASALLHSGRQFVVA